MRKVSRIKAGLWFRLTAWLVYFMIWPWLIWKIRSDNLLVVFLLVAIWLLGAFSLLILWVPGQALIRAVRIREGRKKARLEELDRRFSKATGDDDYFYCDEEGDEDDDIEANDLLYGVILNSGGKSSRDYRVVPSDVRPWFEPYYGIDGLLTLHEHTCGVEDGWINEYDSAFGSPNMWADTDED